MSSLGKEEKTSREEKVKDGMTGLGRKEETSREEWPRMV